MTILIVYGAVGSGKTTKAIELAGDNSYFYNDNISTVDLLNKKNLIVDNADLLKKDILKNIIKYCKAENLILTVTDLNSISKGLKSAARKINTGKEDKRKNDIIKQYPNSTPSSVYDPNIFKVLESIYSNPDRDFVNKMLNEVKPNVYGLLLWMLENDDLELLQYIDREQLFKSKPKFIYATIAYGAKLKNRRINWPKKSAKEKIDEEVKKYFKLRASDMNLLSELLEIPKIKKPKSKKQKKKKVVKQVLINTNESQISNKQSGFEDW